MHLCRAIASIQRDLHAIDAFTWPCIASGMYTAHSVYQTLSRFGKITLHCIYLENLGVVKVQNLHVVGGATSS